jgi:hypothetical protein
MELASCSCAWVQVLHARFISINLLIFYGDKNTQFFWVPGNFGRKSTVVPINIYCNFAVKKVRI